MKNLRNLPKGPLDIYRKRAKFDWKLLKINLEGEDNIEFQNKLWQFIESKDVFRKDSTAIMTLDEQHKICQKRIRALLEAGYHPLQMGYRINYLFYYDSSTAIKIGILNAMVPSTIMALGTDDHADMLNKIIEQEYAGCYALTEISHGSNVKGMKTTATYDVKTKSFYMHTADFEAAKCWAGGLGKTATHALVFVKLITPDGVDRGLHPFFVPIRDPKTLLPYPGITVGDMGEKIALNGIDNGFLMFNNYRVPRTCLLNRNANVTDDGKYVTTFKDDNKRFGASLGALSTGRVNITFISSIYLSLALVIAIRYAAVRKQFGPTDNEEWPVIEYQAQQGRLFPHLAIGYALKIFSFEYCNKIQEFMMKLWSVEDRSLVAAEGAEIHALSSATKPLCSWLARNGIQDCREACGGHGYLKMSRLGDIRSENDANCTYEGECNVLLQQTSNWLLNQWENVRGGKVVHSPFKSADFLTDVKQILQEKFKCSTVEEIINPENILLIYKWLVCYYLTKTYEHVQKLKQKGYSNFMIRNNSQLYFARTLSLVYAEHALVRTFIECTEKTIWRKEEREVLRKLCSLCGLTLLEPRLTDLYAGKYASADSHVDNMVREGIVMLCANLVDDAVALVDVLAPPDTILNSPLGMADGNVYKHIQERFLKNKEHLNRVEWWTEIVQSKL